MIRTFNSNKPGPNLVIVACVHGDELCGKEAFAQFMPNFCPLMGSVTFINGNPKALAVRRREYEANLNRMFRSEDALSVKEKGTYEYRRSRELMPFLAAADALLDIHSSTTKETTPFVICESQSFDCVAVLPVQVVVSGIDVLHPTGTDAFVNSAGGKGICIECGNHNDPRAVEVALEAIKSFLSYFKVIEGSNKIQERQQRYIQANWIYKNVNKFTLTREFTEFERVTQGERIGADGQEDVIAPYDGAILFPNNRIEPNQEAFLLGVE